MSARRSTSTPALAALGALLGLVGALAACGRPPAPTVRAVPPPPAVVEGWVVTAASPITAADRWSGDEVWGDLEGSTLRQVVHTSIGGGAVRVTLSNRAGTEPLVVGAAAVGVAAEAAGSDPVLRPDAVAPLRFGGAAGVTVAPGAEVVSDPVELEVPADHDLAISLHVTAPTGAPNGARFAGQTSWRADGDRVDDVAGTGFDDHRFGLAYVAAVEVRASDPDGAVVVLGDSKSDGGIAVYPDTEGRWPDVLHARLVAEGRLGVGVANVSFMGAMLLPATDPTSGLGRFDADVLARAGVATVVVALGTNDLAWRSAPEIVAGLAELATRGHAAGLRVVGATIPPFAGAAAGGGCVDTEPPDWTREARRLDVNAALTGPDRLGFDAVVDVDAVLRDPDAPSRIACRYSVFGNSHPNSEGHAAIAAAVDLDALLP